MKRVLIAGVGNVLRGDDGFGVRTLERLRSSSLSKRGSVKFWESGIAGVSLVQELMDRYDVLVILDAMDRGGEPGELFVIEPDLDAKEGTRVPVDLHEAKPDGVLRMACALGVLPERVFIVGAQIESCDELSEKLSPAVLRAVSKACERVGELVSGYLSRDVSHVDEMLQILFWLDGEGLAKDASAKELERWLSVPESVIEPTMVRMAALGLLEAIGGGRYRLTERGASEGGRRFSDEFSDMTKPGHGECGDPDCDCYESGDPADCRHASP